MKNKGYTSIRHILKYISLFGSVEILKILANLTRGKVTAILLGPLGAGLIAIYQNILEVIRSCTNIGLETASIQQLFCLIVQLPFSVCSLVTPRLIIRYISPIPHGVKFLVLYHCPPRNAVRFPFDIVFTRSQAKNNLFLSLIRTKINGQINTGNTRDIEEDRAAQQVQYMGIPTAMV